MEKAVAAAPNQVVKTYPTGNSYLWGVTWTGKCDKWGKDEAPIVDWDEVKTSMAFWKNVVPYNPFQYMGGIFSVMKEAM